MIVELAVAENKVENRNTYSATLLKTGSVELHYKRCLQLKIIWIQNLKEIGNIRLESLGT